MKAKILCFYPHNPFTPQHGSHRRCLEIVSGLCELGLDVIFASSPLYSDTSWPEDQEALASCAQGLPLRIALFRPTIADRCWKECWSYLGHLRRQGRPRLDSPYFTPPRMRRWFSRLIDQESPQTILMNYVYWDRLIDHNRHGATRRVMENHDLVSVNQRMQELLHHEFFLPLLAAGTIRDTALDPRYFKKKQVAVASDELMIYDRYSDTMCISAKEAELMRSRLRHSKIHYIPMTFPVTPQRPSFSENPIAALGPNLFNLQGYYLFTKNILPRIHASDPAFALTVAGSFYRNFIPPSPPTGIIITGFINDLSKALLQARFAINPTFSGTGQQIKTIEAMAHGLAVVAWEEPAKNSPLQHNINGLIARNEEEFAAHCLALWRSPDLCRRLGAEAQKSVASEFSRPRLLKDLSALFSSPEPR